MAENRLFGLIGYPLSHSFSKRYFTEKFEREGIPNCRYELFPLQNIEELPALVETHKDLVGLNVTIPYKKQVIPFLQEIDGEAAAVGAINTIKIENGRLKGYNSDVYGFEVSLLKLLGKVYELENLDALILGTGGAAKAVAFVLSRLGIGFTFVSRNVGEDRIRYEELDQAIMQKHRLIVNTTPLGMSPNVDAAPAIPYQWLGENHFLYDLVYNPPVTAFMQQGKDRNCQVENGLEMLHLQAERSWEIWQ